MNKIDKKSIRVIIFSVVFLFVIGFFVFMFVNYSKDDKSFSIVEKKWITSSANNIININVFNDVPLYGYNGNGVIFDFLDKFSEEYNVNFNKISYYSTDTPIYGDLAFRVLGENDKIGSNDILLYKDDYVLVSKDDYIVNDIYSIDKVATIDSEYEVISSYLNDKDKVLHYRNMSSLMKAMNEGSFKYVMLPNVMYMDKILNNDLKILYHISDLNKKYVLTVKDDIVYSIMNKYYLKFKDSYLKQSLSKNYLSVFFNSTNISSLEQKNYNGRIYKYGYYVNMPYENNVSGNFVGVLSNYLSEFESLSNTEINALRYNSADDVKNALVSEEIDFALTTFDYNNINMDKYVTLSFLDEEYVVLSRDNININSIKGLRDYEVLVVGSSNLYNLLISNNISPKIFKNTDDLLRNITLDSVILIDKNTYLYYKDAKFSNYVISYNGVINDGYRFIINNKYLTFAKLFDYYVSSVDYNDVRFKYNTNVSLDKGNNNIIFIVLVIVVILSFSLLAYYISKRKEIINNINKDDKFKYLDTMTGLKNRNYLNHNIYNWDDNVIFPQSIIMLDINNLKEINDRLGREAGDELIKKVAGVLINNQLENTDIIRSGGDEFLIYLVGYDEKSTVEFAKRMTKLMKDLSHSMGVEYGYSMIMDEVKTIDDAINESISMMAKSKDKNKDK